MMSSPRPARPRLPPTSAAGSNGPIDRYTNGDLERRHSGKHITSYIDGHVEAADGLVKLIGFAADPAAAPAAKNFLFDSSKPADHEAGQACITLPISAWTGTVPYTSVGAHGYIAWTGASTVIINKVKLPFTTPTISGFTGSANWQKMGIVSGPGGTTPWDLCEDVEGRYGSANGGVTFPMIQDNTSTGKITLTLPDLKPHILTVLSPSKDKTRGQTLSLGWTGGTTSLAVADTRTRLASHCVAQFRFCGSVVLSVRLHSAPDSNINGASVRGLILD
jgi:prepilin-type processing-associated H-X9-DG protein